MTSGIMPPLFRTACNVMFRMLRWALIISTGWVFASAATPVKVAIIIDDIGFQKTEPALIQLPYQLTFAIMPFTPQGLEMAQLAARHQKEIMLHMPMEAVAQNHLLGRGALRRDMTKIQVQQALNAALAQYPQARGVNNHMGSKFTSLAEPMGWVLEVVKQHQLFFIDSKTTNHSVVTASASHWQVPSRSRDVFLDNDKRYSALDRQFNQLIEVAKQHGSAIAIGHPYPETLQYLRKNLPRLAAHGIELVPVSALVHEPRLSAAKEPAHTQPAPEAQPSLIAEPELQPWRLPLRLDADGIRPPAPTPIVDNPLPQWRWH